MGNHMLIRIGGLSGGMAKVDPSDYERLTRHSWYCRDGYALTTVNGSEKRMHRMVLGVTDPLVIVDHRNGDRLDNRRANLRPFTPTQNANNRKDNLNLTVWGETKTLAEWCRDPRCGASYDVVRGRLRKGIPAYLALLAAE